MIIDIHTDLHIPTLFDPDTRTLTYGTKPCMGCGAAHERWGQPRGRRVAWHGKMCDKCRGTGRRGSGKCRTCNDYGNRDYPQGQVRDWDRPYDDGECEMCAGTGVRRATRYDHVPRDTVAAIMATIGDTSIKIMPGDQQTSAESLFGVITFTPERSGMTNFWGTTDYGRAWEPLRVAAQTDSTARALGQDVPDALPAAIAEFKAAIRSAIIEHSPMQGASVALPDERVIDTIVVRITPQGYTLMGAVRDAILSAHPEASHG